MAITRVQTAKRAVSDVIDRPLYFLKSWDWNERSAAHVSGRRAEVPVRRNAANSGRMTCPRDMVLQNVAV